MSDAERIRAFRHALEDGAAEERVPFAHGTGIFAPSIANVYDANYLRAERESDADELARAADVLMDGYLHRKVTIDRGGAALAPRFADLGYTSTEHVVMALHRDPDKAADTSSIREVSFDDVAPVMREKRLSAPRGDDELAEMLAEATRRTALAVGMRHFAAYVGGDVAAYCELLGRGDIGQIEDVNTLERFRGRGLGRAVIQAALDAARASHELVFLEALAEDWPRYLYEKLGFDTVDSRHLFLRPPHPLTGLRLRTPHLELRLATVAELRALAEVARAGIHPPEEMPFGVAWTDNATSPSFVHDFVSFHELQLRESQPGDWTLNLVAFMDGEPVGSQTLHGERFAETHIVGTGSWLGAPWQGRDLGTEMRAAVLELAFAGLGAEAATSGAVTGNAASLGVSRRLGYVETEMSTVAPRGEPVQHHDLRRDAAGWRSPVPVEIEGLPPLLSHFGVAP